MIAELANRFRNSSRTVLTLPMVSGDSPSDRHPSQFGRKSHQGTMLPCITSGAILNDVVKVQ